jgi:competence protein ComEC
LADFAYQDFLAKDGIYSIIYSPQLELISRGEYDNFGSVIFSGILNLKDKLRETIDRYFPQPQGSVLSAIVLGDKRQLSLEWKDKLNRAGLRHLTAISGMHITILTTVLMSLFLSLGFWRQQAFYLTLALIIIFIVLIGCQPSAVRAGIMGGLFLLAQFLGRQGQSWRMIVLAASLMLFCNPLLLKSDIGFQLSFLAVLGIIFFLPIFRFWLRRMPNFLGVREALSLTLAAQVFTLPVLIFNFGYVSLVAPLGNILVVPFLPFIMCLGLAFVLSGSLIGFLAMVFSWPLWLVLTYLLKVTAWLSSYPVLFFQVSWFWLLAYCLGIIIFLRRFGQKRKLRFLKY